MSSNQTKYMRVTFFQGKLWVIRNTLTPKEQQFQQPRRVRRWFTLFQSLTSSFKVPISWESSLMSQWVDCYRISWKESTKGISKSWLPKILQGQQVWEVFRQSKRLQDRFNQQMKENVFRNQEPGNSYKEQQEKSLPKYLPKFKKWLKRQEWELKSEQGQKRTTLPHKILNRVPGNLPKLE